MRLTGYPRILALLPFLPRYSEHRPKSPVAIKKHQNVDLLLIKSEKGFARKGFLSGLFRILHYLSSIRHFGFPNTDTRPYLDSSIPVPPIIRELI